MAERLIRDFIYLDIERIRSFVAQLYEGLTQSRTSQSENQAGGEGQAKGRIPLLAEATGTVNYHYLRTESETKSFHDQIFDELYRKLAHENYIWDLTHISADNWSEDLLNDGSFIETRGLLKIVDYKYSMSTIEVLPNLMDMILKLSSGPQTPSMQANTRRQPTIKGQLKVMAQQTNTNEQADNSNIQQMKALKEQLKTLPIKPLATIVDQLYGDLIRVKIFPFSENNPDKVLVGTAIRELFRYPPSTLATLYGTAIDAGWTSILQVNKGKQHQPGQLASQTGNKMEDGLEGLADYLAVVGNITQGVSFPALAVTPIAIFREITKK